MHCNRSTIPITAITLLAALPSLAQITYDMTVAKDGSGTHTTVQAAFNAVPQNSGSRTVIYVKNGAYKENLTLASTRKNVTLIGQSRDGVKLTYDNYSSKINPATGAEYGTSGSSSTFIDADGFCALNVTFENSAGPVGQAVAVRVSGDRAIFYNCNFLGRQDTWYGIRCRILVRKCYLEGTTDFMFGASTTWFDSCQIYSYGGTALTAASTEPYVTYGYVFRYCSITGASGVSTALGRPWRPYSAVSFQYCSMTSCIKAAGWDNWGDAANERTARYSEYKNTGAGAAVSGRVSWAKQLSDAQAAAFTVANVFRTTYADPPVVDNWDPLATLNPYTSNSTGTLDGHPPAIPDLSVATGPGGRTLLISRIAPGTPVFVTVHSLDGKVIRQVQAMGKNALSVSLDDRPKGVCIVRVRNLEAETYRRTTPIPLFICPSP